MEKYWTPKLTNETGCAGLTTKLKEEAKTSRKPEVLRKRELLGRVVKLAGNRPEHKRWNLPKSTRNKANS